MKLNHLNLTVTDVLATSQFLKKYFGLQNMAGAADDDKFNFLFDDNGMVISLLKIAKPGAVTYPPTFHMCCGPPGILSPQKISAGC